MANQWFKLYGVEMLADPKYQRLNAGERSMWVTLLCLASMDNGCIKHCEEPYLVAHSGIDPMEINKYHGTLIKFEMLGFITKKRDENGMEVIEIKNWHKRQEVYSESRDRVKKWREKQRENQNVTPVTLHSNGKNRIEENRIDKNISNRFVKPTVEEIESYIKEKGYSVDANTFFNFYESKGWKVGKSPMVSWKASVATWNKGQNKTTTKSITI